MAHPRCPYSLRPSTKFCIAKDCMCMPFCCSSCSNEQCIRSHMHRPFHAETMFWEQVAPALEVLFNSKDSCMLGEEYVDALTKKVEALVHELQGRLTELKVAVKECRSRQMVKQNLQVIMQKITHCPQSVTGSEMAELVKAIQECEVYAFQHEAEAEIRTKCQKLDRLLTNVQYGLSKHTDLVQHLQHVARYAMNAGQFRVAHGIFNQLVQLNPLSVNMISCRGYCSEKMDKLDKAVEDFSACISMSPDNPSFYFNKAVILHNMGRLEQALQQYSMAIELDDQNHEYFEARARVRLSILEQKKDELVRAVKTEVEQDVRMIVELETTDM